MPLRALAAPCRQKKAAMTLSAPHQRVYLAADALIAQGIWPTVQEVRARMGSGSNTTINDALKTWRESFLQRTAQAARRPDWPEGLEAAVETLWQNACTQAASQWDSERAQSQQQLTAAQAEQATWQAAAHAQEQHAADLSAQLAAALNQIDALHRALAEAEQREAELDTQLAAQTTQLAQQTRDHAAALAAQRAEQQAQQLAHANALATQKAEADQREAQAYERLEGLRQHLYAQAESERAQFREARQQWVVEAERGQTEARRRESLWEGRWQTELQARHQAEAALAAHQTLLLQATEQQQWLKQQLAEHAADLSHAHASLDALTARLPLPPEPEVQP